MSSSSSIALPNIVLPLPVTHFADEEPASGIFADEIIWMIFQFCLLDQNLKTAQALCMTCKKFNRIVNGIPFFMWARFLSNLQHFNIRQVTISIDPNLFLHLDTLRPKRTVYAHLSRRDPKDNFIYNLLRLNIAEILQRSKGEASKKYPLACSDINSGYYDHKLYGLIKHILQIWPWRVDLRAPNYARLTKECPDPNLREIVIKTCRQINILRVARTNNIAGLVEILDNEIMGSAYSLENGNINHLISWHLLNNHDFRRVAILRNYETAQQLVQNAFDIDHLKTLLYFIFKSPFIHDLVRLKKLLRSALVKHVFCLPRILELLKSNTILLDLEKNTIEDYCITLALQINPKVGVCIPVI